MRQIDKSLIGQKFNRLLIQDIFRKDNKTYAHCLCNCGAEKDILLARIKNKNTQSCGCLHRELLSALSSTHHSSGTRLYNIWCNIKGRCKNSSHRDYCNYGGRGISLCKEWDNSFETFRDWAYNNGYSDTLSIDRINVDGNYEPTNCRWTDSYTQNSNKRLNSCNKTGYSGIDFRENEKKYVVRKTIRGTRYYIGYFNTLEEAVIAKQKFLKARGLEE